MESQRAYPFKIEEKSTLVNEKGDGFTPIKVVSENDGKIYRVSTEFGKAAKDIYNFKVRSEDVWVVSYPRSGTTVTQEMVWLIVNNDYETAKNVPLIERFPYLEIGTSFTEEVLDKTKVKFNDNKDELVNISEIIKGHWLTLNDKVGRRFIKTHLHIALLPPELLTSGCKVVYIARNPKDVAVSLFKFIAGKAPDHQFGKFWDLFQSDSTVYAPYWDHVVQGWERRHDKNFCFLFYEDMVKDMRATIRKVAKFLEKDIKEEEVEKLAEHLDIENVRKNKSLTKNYYNVIHGAELRKMIRKGGVGGWKDYFTKELDDKANTWISENYKNTDLRFPVCLTNCGCNK